jgi:hypothetical protein
MQPAPQDNQLMSKHRVLSLKSNLRLEWGGQDGQNETEQPDHSANLGDSEKVLGTHNPPFAAPLRNASIRACCSSTPT